MDIGPIIFDLQGLEISQAEQDLLTHPMIGGVILFSRNFTDVQQLTSLTKSIRSVKQDALIMVDQEGGRVQRFKQGFTELPSLRELGRYYDICADSQPKALEISYKLGELMAMEILATGIDLSLAPVVDLDRSLSEIIGNRAFHSKVDVLITLARSYIQGMEAAGMPATLKHFPGHGAVVLDSHLALPHDERPMDKVKEDMKPFEELAHDPNVKAVMPAHIVFDNLDSKPPCFSSFWLQEILRKQIGYEGAIISDDLSMEGAASIGPYPQRVSQALDAGCDIVLVCNNRDGLMDILSNEFTSDHEQSRMRRSQLKGAYHYDFANLDKRHSWSVARRSLQDLLNAFDLEPIHAR